MQNLCFTHGIILKSFFEHYDFLRCSFILHCSLNCSLLYLQQENRQAQLQTLQWKFQDNNMILSEIALTSDS